MPRQRPETTATTSPQEPRGWRDVTLHVASCLAQSPLPAGEGWQDGAGCPVPPPKPQLGSPTCHYGVTNVVSVDGEQLQVAKMEIKMEQLSVANSHPLRTGRKEGTSLILVCYCFYKKAFANSSRTCNVCLPNSRISSAHCHTKIIHAHNNSFYLDFFFF